MKCTQTRTGGEPLLPPLGRDDDGVDAERGARRVVPVSVLGVIEATGMGQSKRPPPRVFRHVPPRPIHIDPFTLHANALGHGRVVQLLPRAARPVHKAQEPRPVKEAEEELRGVGLPEGHPLQRGGLVLFVFGVTEGGWVSWWVRAGFEKLRGAESIDQFD